MSAASAPSPFCQTAPQVQKAWDNTSLSVLKECPRKYQLFILEGWRPKGDFAATPLMYGGLFHRGIEVYERVLAAQRAALTGRPDEELREKACVEAVRVLLTESGRWEAEGDPATGEVIADRFIPWSPDDTYRNRQTLVRNFVWYLEQYAADICQTLILPDGTPAVELSFRFELPLESPDGDAFIYCGHIDKVDRLGEDEVILDHKTTAQSLGSWYQDKLSPNAQFSGYLYAGKLVLGKPIKMLIVNTMQVAVGFARFARYITHRTNLQLEEWLNNTLHWIRQAESFAASGYWPMNEESCHKFAGCQYREVCSKCPSVRQKWLEANYKREPWNPLENRGGDEG